MRDGQEKFAFYADACSNEHARGRGNLRRLMGGRWGDGFVGEDIPRGNTVTARDLAKIPDGHRIRLIGWGERGNQFVRPRGLLSGLYDANLRASNGRRSIEGADDAGEVLLREMAIEQLDTKWLFLTNEDGRPHKVRFVNDLFFARQPTLREAVRRAPLRSPWRPSLV